MPRHLGDLESRQLRLEQFQRAIQQLRVVRLMNPATRPRWVRQGNHHRGPSHERNYVRATNQSVQRQSWKKSCYGESADGNYQRGPNEAELRVEPYLTVLLLQRGWHAVAATGGAWPRITPGDRSDVDVSASGSLIDSGPLEPAKERFSGTARERPTAARLNLTGRLSHEHGPWGRGDGDNRHNGIAVATQAALGQRTTVRRKRR
jgi:hypothetical protein